MNKQNGKRKRVFFFHSHLYIGGQENMYVQVIWHII